MEWGGLILQAILLGGFLIWEGYFKQKGKNLAEKEDSKEIAMLKKMGEDIATKDDIGDITKEVESVKVSYNESLERHKIELQKEFESHKYIKELCNKIDHELLTKLIKCKKEITGHLEEHADNSNYDSCESSIRPLIEHLNDYQARYKDTENGNDIINTFDKIIHIDDKDDLNKMDYEAPLNDIRTSIDKFIAEFVPIRKPEH